MARRFKIIIAFFLWISAPRFAAGQISIRQETTLEPMSIDQIDNGKDPLASEIVAPKYTTPAMIRAERIRKRHERNKFEMTLETKVNQSQVSNWAKGGDNTFNGLIYFKAKHTYKNDRLSFITDFDTRLGVDIIDTVVFKSQDYFNIKHQTGWDISKNWSLAGTINLRSQYMKGYKSKSDHTLVSSFMSPGTLDVAMGFRYKPKYWNITLSPISGKMTFVLSDTLSKKGISGVEKGKHVKPMVGPSIFIDFERKFAKDKLGYHTTINGFWNFKLDPTANWENTFDIYATKWLKTSFYWYLIYDREANVPKKNEGKFLQWSSSIGLTLTFTFKSKSATPAKK